MGFTFNTLQANRGMQGNYTAGTTIPGIGVGIYTGTTGDVEIETVGGDTVLYTGVPQGIFLQVPLFSAIGSNTTATDLSISYVAPPFK